MQFIGEMNPDTLIVSLVSPRTGLAGSIELTVAHEDTALALRSGVVPVLGTPRLVALCEEASIAACEGTLDEGDTTVGLNVRLDHLHPCPIGDVVTAEATLEKIEGRRLHFNVLAKDVRGLVAAGKITRVVVNQERFMERTE